MQVEINDEVWKKIVQVGEELGLPTTDMTLDIIVEEWIANVKGGMSHECLAGWCDSCFNDITCTCSCHQDSK